MGRLYVFTFGLLLSLVASAVVAQDSHEGHQAKGGDAMEEAAETDRDGMGHMGMKPGMMGKAGMDHSKHMQEMHAKMGKLNDHTKKMEGMTDPEDLADEMKKHMRMMDDMMEKMMATMMQGDM